MRTRTSLLGGAALLAATAAACGSAPPPAATTSAPALAPRPAAPSRAAQAAAAPRDPCARRRPGVAPRPDAPLRQGSAIALARMDDRTVAYVADADRRAVHTVDVEARVRLATTPLGGAPAQILVLSDGRVAVAIRDRNEVALLDPGADPAAPLSPLCATGVPSEPVALAAGLKERELFVTSGWGRALTALDSASLATTFSVPLPREPRAVVIEPTGRRAFVSHAIGDSLSVVDLWNEAYPVRGVQVRAEGSFGSGERHEGQGFALVQVVARGAGGGAEAVREERATRLLAPLVSVDSGAGSMSTEVYGTKSLAAAPRVAVIDAGTESLMSRKLHASDIHDLGGPARACTLPRAAALARERLLVACLGIDAVLELDARARDPMRFEHRRFHVPAGPVGVAIDGDRGRAVVWSQFAAVVSVLDLRDAAVPAAEIAVAEGPPPDLTAAEARGRLLFHATHDPRLSGDGRACASCHIDGRDDGLTWSTPEGPHQTIMLAGRVDGTAPFGWRGDTPTLRHHVGITLKRLGGRGVWSAADSADLDALIAYLKVMPAPSPASLDDERRRLALRGQALFEDSRQGCAACHMGGGTDGAAHEVARSPFKIPFDTPSLRFVGGTAPYYHDGRYPTLAELLRGADGAMGHTGALSDEELRALEAYLEVL
jgi:mono/diheme cytochrome c family protein